MAYCSINILNAKPRASNMMQLVCRAPLPFPWAVTVSTAKDGVHRHMYGGDRTALVRIPLLEKLLI